jgi:hypothetical protein
MDFFRKRTESTLEVSLHGEGRMRKRGAGVCKKIPTTSQVSYGGGIGGEVSGGHGLQLKVQGAKDARYIGATPY